MYNENFSLVYTIGLVFRNGTAHVSARQLIRSDDNYSKVLPLFYYIFLHQKAWFK